jgi:hypothetical protein
LRFEGAAGNVIAYNYASGTFGIPSTTTNSFEEHTAHIQFTLLEGNVFPGEWLDIVHGSNSQTTSFRNWEEGTTYVCSPTDGSRQTVDCSSGTWSYQAPRAITFDSFSSYNNIVGDIIGSAMQSALGGSTLQAIINWNAKRSYSGAYGLSFGYGNYSDSGTNSFDSTVPASTVFIHGLYNNIGGSTTWASGITHTLPRSFYLSGTPSWWGTLPFPAIGPDISGGAGPGGHVGTIPAERCYLTVMGGTEGGAGGPLTFNASLCYGLPPPTGLTGTVH